MDAMTAAQLWMGTYLVLLGIGSMNRANGWLLLFLLVFCIVVGTAFVFISGYWPLIVLPASMLVHTVQTIHVAWKQAVQDAKEAL
jgi:hypothetical protein